MLSLPRLGYGIGLRTEHYVDVVSGAPAVDWFEVISENFMVPGGNARRVLRAVRERWPVVLHGVALSLGGVDPLDEGYLDALAALAAEVEPAWVSDHLCWAAHRGHQAHDLLPLPFTEEALAHVAERVLRVQDRLKRQILVENVSSYVTFAQSSMPEWAFLAELTRRTDCGLLLDVNNVFVSAHNHGFDARAFLDGIPADRVGQIHLAGHSEDGALLIDTHDHPVRDEVWALYRHAVARFGPVSTLIEWDERLPPLERVVEESKRAAAEAQAVLAGAREPAAAGGAERPDVGTGVHEPVLADAQARLFALVTAPEGVAAGLRERGFGPADLTGWVGVRGDERRSALGRLDVYANMYFFRLLDVLRDVFPKLAQAIGDDAFHNLVTDYLLVCPPEQPSLRWLGARLPAYLRRHALAAERPELGDLAALEWARYDVFDAADAEVLTVEALRALPPEAFVTLPLRLVPAQARLAVGWPAEALWAQPDAPPAKAPAARTLLVWRRDVAVYHRVLDDDEAAALALVDEGTEFGALCDWLAARVGEDAAAPAAYQLLSQWASDGLLVSV